MKVDTAKKSVRKSMRSLRSFWSAVIFLPLFIFATYSFVVTPVGAAASSTNIWVFSLENTTEMSRAGTAQSGVGAFSTGNAGPYMEGACIPFIVEAENTDTATGDVTFEVEYDYSSIEEGFDDLENIAVSASDITGNPRSAANDLNDFTYPGTPFSSGTVQTNGGSSLSMTVTGPTDDTHDIRYYGVTVKDVPGGDTAYVLFCGRLGDDAGEAPGASLGVRLRAGGKENKPVKSGDLIELPSLTITKVVSGGTAHADEWSFVITPGVDGVSASTTVNVVDSDSNISDASVTVENINVSTATNFTVTEAGGNADYTFSSGSGTNCVFTEATATASIAPDSTAPVNASCTFTNAYDPAPTTITVVKVVDNTHGGTLTPADFTMRVTDGDLVTQTGIPSDADGDGVYSVTFTVAPGDYEVSEDSVAGYDLDEQSTDCRGNITTGQSKTCTLTNVDQQPVVVVKKVVSGGDAVPGDFTILVDATNPTDGIETPRTSIEGNEAGIGVWLDAGEYSFVEEATDSDYVATYSDDCSSATSSPIAVGDAVRTCTITNTYTPTPVGTLIVTKDFEFIDDVSATADDFDFFITDEDGNTEQVIALGFGRFVAPGTYTISESGLSGYTPVFGGDCNSSGVIEVVAGEVATCDIVNVENPPAPSPTEPISPVLICVEPNETTGYTAYWGYNSDNTETVYIPVGSSNYFSGGSTTDEGQPELFETGAHGTYPEAVFTSEFTAIQDITWTIVANGVTRRATAAADSVSCVTPEPAELTVVVKVNNSTGSLEPADIDVSVTGSDVTPDSFQGDDAGTLVTLSEGAFDVSSGEVTGYTRTESGDCGDVDAVAGETDLICTITYTEDVEETLDGTIVVTKHVVNGDAFGAEVSDFELYVGPERVDSGVGESFAPGTYRISERVDDGIGSLLGKFTASFSDECADGIVVLEPGEKVNCELTNTFPGASRLVVITNVINDNSGIQTPSMFDVTVTGTDVSDASFPGSSDGVTVDLDPGSFSVESEASSGYSLSYSGDCSGTINVEETLTCVITYNDEVPPSGGGGGSDRDGNGSDRGPSGEVLGDTDENVDDNTDDGDVGGDLEPIENDPIVITPPAGEVLGDTDEQLPRTGFPVGILMSLFGALVYAVRRLA